MSVFSLLRASQFLTDMQPKISLKEISDAVLQDDTKLIQKLIEPLQHINKKCFINGVRFSTSSSTPFKLVFAFEYDPCDGMNPIKYTMIVTPVFGGFWIAVQGLDYENSLSELTSFFEQVFKQ